jgi:long-chain acyl-CoA synthetase
VALSPEPGAWSLSAVLPYAAVIPSTDEQDAAVDVDVTTIAELPFHMMGRFPKPVTIGRCQVDGILELSSKEVFERIRDLSLGFRALGISAGDRVAIISESRPEWLLCDLAVLTAGAVTVPIYPTLSASQARYILQDSGARLAVVSTRLQLEKMQEVRHLLPMLEAVVSMDAAAASGAPASASAPALEDVERRGHARMTGEWGAAREFRDIARAVSANDLATIIYTSGTTGEPKGVMLTHANLVANMRAASAALEISQDDVALSFLPLSHAFERMVSYVYLFSGVTIVFAESFDTVGRDMARVRPTVLTGVPRVYEKLQARIVDTAQAAGGAKAAVFRWAVNAGLVRAKAVLRGRRPGPITSLKTVIGDRLVFSAIREKFGGRLRFVASGSAPLTGNVMEFFHAVGIPIIEGYGLTETAPILTFNPLHALRVGTVGRAIPGVELRIADDGEILARGPNVMRGYFNKPEATAEALKDGWFHTGDIGQIDAEGYLSITDRKKDLLVTSGGKKIAPQPIEGVLKRSPIVGEAVLLGDRRKYAAVLIVPEFAALERRLKDLGRPPGSRAELVARPDVVALYQEIVDALNRDLSQFERIKRIALLPSEFSVESGELTPTLKVKRKVVEQRWHEQIEALYHE